MGKDSSKHNLENLRELVDAHFPKQSLLKYYPYGPEKTWDYWCTGEIDLSKVHKDPRFKKKTEKDYIFSIVEEVARAMNYLTLNASGTDGFDHQRLEAHAMWHLIHAGDMGWSKDSLKGLSKSKINSLLDLHKDRADQVYGRGKYANAKRQKEEAALLDSMTKKKRKEYLKLTDSRGNGYLDTYGIYEIRQFPLIPFSNSMAKFKSFYTKQQLAAIHVMVICAFENLC